MQAKQKQGKRTNPAKKAGKFDSVRPNKEQKEVLNPAVEQIVHAIVYGEQALPAWDEVSGGTRIFEKSPTGHVTVGIYHPAFDEVRMHSTQISALASLGVPYREVLARLLTMTDADGVGAVLLGPKFNNGRNYVDAQPVVFPVDALYAAARDYVMNGEVLHAS